MGTRIWFILFWDWSQGSFSVNCTYTGCCRLNIFNFILLILFSHREQGSAGRSWINIQIQEEPNSTDAVILQQLQQLCLTLASYICLTCCQHVFCVLNRSRVRWARRRRQTAPQRDLQLTASLCFPPRASSWVKRSVFCLQKCTNPRQVAAKNIVNYSEGWDQQILSSC